MASRIERVKGNIYRLVEETSHRGRKDAEQLFKKAVERGGNGDLNGAIELYEQAVGCWPAHFGSWMNMGNAWLAKGEFTMAQRCYREAGKIAPNDVIVHYDLGIVLDALGKKKEAIGEHLKALALDPRHADAHYNIALVYAEMGEDRKALKHYVHYLKFSNVDDESDRARAQREIKRLRGDGFPVVPRKAPADATDDGKHLSIAAEK